ncbi:hypothetical protein [Streptomyces sp. NPDC012888]|uniref:hypothetical protein n=1 Tax=Streptomyces sp. NPDC012888 TaxID=3364855 RepID=UPI0036D13A9B
MPNPPPGRWENRFPWWPALSLICAATCALALHRRITGPAPSPPGLPRGGLRPFRDDAAAHLTTSW